jgi:uncharacterized membrane protein
VRLLVLAACVVLFQGCDRTPAPTSAAPHTGGPTVPPLQLLGTEPFWSLRFGAEMVFTTPEDTVGLRLPRTTPTLTGDTLRWAGMVGADSFEIRVWEIVCSDGMSDTEYPFTSSVRIGDRRLSGCARQWLPPP